MHEESQRAVRCYKAGGKQSNEAEVSVLKTAFLQAAPKALPLGRGTVRI